MLSIYKPWGTVIKFSSDSKTAHYSLTDWKKTMADYKGGVDYPVSFFYKELMVAYPKAKVFYVRKSMK